MKTITSIVFLIISTIVNKTLQDDKECSPTKNVCEYWFTVDERLTMHWGNKRVEASNRTLYKFDESPSDIKTKVPLEEVITMDGIYRTVTVVNNSLPGPPIIVYKGQQVIIHVTNELLNEAVTIHWHGIHQKDTPFMDGVAFVTQCPISPGQTFTYKFKAPVHGTFFYHSHIDGQRVDGLFGALIIKKNESSNDIEEHLMHVGDWFHDHGSELHVKMISANFKSEPGFVQPQTLDGVKFAPALFKSAHIEGRGSYRDPTTGKWTETPLKEYTVKSGKKYRFRLIATGNLYPMIVSIDKHTLTVVASDGFDVEPSDYESIVLYPGERYDFLITANQPADNYWIRASSMEVNFPDHYVKAILRYNSNSTDDPTSNQTTCLPNNNCVVLNCPFSYFPSNQNTRCVTVDKLNRTGGEVTPTFENDSQEYIMNYVQGKGGMNINGRLFQRTSMSSLTQDGIIDKKQYSCDKIECQNINETCSCHYQIKIPFNKTIQMIWTNHGKGATRHHPIHFHGHTFHVLKLAYGSYNETSALRLQDNHDIACIGYPCYKTKWQNVTWRGDNIPGLKIANAPQKDTLIIPTGAYAVVRFRSNNPGKWFMHCHLEFHAMQGMSMIMNEAPEKHPKPPFGFPVCHDFYDDPKKDVQYEVCKAKKVDGAWSKWGRFEVCSSSCGGGTRNSSRECNNPKPRNGGKVCSGNKTHIETCNTAACPVKVDGVWSKWGRFKVCSLSCGRGTRKSTRECNNPKPLNGGKVCSGNKTHTETCNTAACPGKEKTTSWKFTGVSDIVHILFFVFLGLFVIETVILIAYCCCCKKKNGKEGTAAGTNNYAMS